MSEAQKGLIALVLASAFWGLAPMFWKMLAHLPASEVLAHRTLWSAIIFVSWLAIKGQLAEVRAALSNWRQVAVILLAACLISVNWGLFIWAIATNQATEASLGYFLFPLVAVLAGRVVFGERLSQAQRAAVAMATGAVGILTVGLGSAPWIALVLAFSFGLYGVVKKLLSVGPVVSVTSEVVVLSPLALGFLIVYAPSGIATLSASDWLLLMVSGLVTALPLMLFSYGARRARMTTVGLAGYINPTLQFFCAVVIFVEPLGPWHLIAFPLIWLALAIYTHAAWRIDRRSRRMGQVNPSAKAVSNVRTSGTN